MLHQVGVLETNPMQCTVHPVVFFLQNIIYCKRFAESHPHDLFSSY